MGPKFLINIEINCLRLPCTVGVLLDLALKGDVLSPFLNAYSLFSPPVFGKQGGYLKHCLSRSLLIF